MPPSQAHLLLWLAAESEAWSEIPVEAASLMMATSFLPAMKASLEQGKRQEDMECDHCKQIPDLRMMTSENCRIKVKSAT